MQNILHVRTYPADEICTIFFSLSQKLAIFCHMHYIDVDLQSYREFLGCLTLLIYETAASSICYTNVHFVTFLTAGILRRCFPFNLIQIRHDTD